MTKDTPNPTPPPRPGDPFTAQDGLRLYDLINSMSKRQSSSIDTLASQITTIHKLMIELNALAQVIEEGLTENRVGRLEMELREAMLEKEVAERNLKAKEEKLNLKQSVKENNSVDTQERMNIAAAKAYAEIEKKEKETRDVFVLDLKRSIIKAVLVSLAIGATSGTLAFLWWLFQQYINR
jgi:hypothetical protein